MKLRNIGGVIVVDFIDMDPEEINFNYLSILLQQSKMILLASIAQLTELGLVG